LGSGFGLTPAMAQNSGLPTGAAPALAPYQVTGIDVDATAENAVKARDAALAQGQVQALGQLLQRLVAPTYYANLPQPSASEVEQMVLGVSIRDEKTSAVRYLAKVDVSFMPQAVQNLLTKANIPFVEGTERPMIVLPVWQGAADSPMVLWEEPNPWREAWAARNSGGLVSTAVPLGDIADLSIIDVDRAHAADGRALAAITERYGAEGAMVVEAEADAKPPTADPALPPTIRIRVMQSALSGAAPLALVVTPAVGETLEKMLERAVIETSQAIDGAWKKQALTYAGPLTVQAMSVRFSSFDEWLIIRNGIDQTPAVREWSLSQLQRQQAQVQLSFSGSSENLIGALAGAGVTMMPEAGGWVLMRGASHPVYTPAAGDPAAVEPVMAEPTPAPVVVQ
jgi:hypothetical protein